jgi:hypothetical protein
MKFFLTLLLLQLSLLEVSSGHNFSVPGYSAQAKINRDTFYLDTLFITDRTSDFEFTGWSTSKEEAVFMYVIVNRTNATISINPTSSGYLYPMYAKSVIPPDETSAVRYVVSTKGREIINATMSIRYCTIGTADCKVIHGILRGKVND